VIDGSAETPVAPAAGEKELTDGFAVSVPDLAVVKLHFFVAASGVPNRSVTPVERVAVKVVPGARLAVGVKVAVNPLHLTVPPTAIPLEFFTLKVVPVRVEHFIGALNDADTTRFRRTPVAPAAGVTVRTVGATGTAARAPPWNTGSMANAIIPSAAAAALKPRLLPIFFSLTQNGPKSRTYKRLTLREGQMAERRRCCAQRLMFCLSGQARRDPPLMRDGTACPF
jgi:hypothetical protein